MRHFEISDRGPGAVAIIATYSDDAYHRVRTLNRFSLKAARAIAKLANALANAENGGAELSNEALQAALNRAIDAR